jgi:hypothetical protein
MSGNTLRDLAIDLVELHASTVESFRDSNGNIDAEAVDDRTLRMNSVEALRLESEIGWVVHYLRETTDNVSQVEGDLSHIKEVNGRLRNQLGEQIEGALREQFDRLYQSYPSRVCDAFEFEPIPDETTNDIESRDVLQFLYEELGIDDEAIEEGFRVADTILECKYRRNADIVRELNIDQPYKPDRYWWRHPEQVLSEK